MLKILVPMGEEYYDESKEEFVAPNGFELELEHSLVSLSKWEAREEVPFLSNDNKTTEQTLGYIRDMLVTPNVPDEVFKLLIENHLGEVNRHIEAKMTATTIKELGPARSSSRSELITSELIYYWMVSLNIPFDPAQHWHVNRLFMLIRVCNEKNKPSKKMPRQSAVQRQRELNAQRRAQYGTRG